MWICKRAMGKTWEMKPRLLYSD